MVGLEVLQRQDGRGRGYLLRAILVYKPKDLNRDWSPRFSTLRDKNGWIRAKTAGNLNLGVSRNRFCDFLADPDSRNFSRFYTNIGRSRYSGTSILTPNAVRKRSCVPDFAYNNDPFYQARLGTDAGKALKKVPFSRRR